MHLALIREFEAFLVKEVRNLILADICITCDDTVTALEHLPQIMLADYDIVEDTAAVLFQN